MKKLLYVTLVVVVSLFGLTFSYKNHQRVEIDYYFGVDFQMDLALLLFLTFALGLTAGALATALGALNARRKRARAKRQPNTLPSVNT